jgi:hypothetical protein
MQYTSIFTILALAMTAAAAPSEKLPRVQSNIASCNSATQNVCCNGVANCILTVAGKNCEGSAYCCDTDGVQVSITTTPSPP